VRKEEKSVSDFNSKQRTRKKERKGRIGQTATARTECLNLKHSKKHTEDNDG
jgi:hypothetical protein